jgi:hypothetical protein
MAPPGSQQKPIEFADKFLRPADFIGEPFSFRSPDSSLDRVPVEAAENLL